MTQFPVRAVVAVLLTWLPTAAYGWWDEGHMIVAAVAKQLLTKEEVEKIESILAFWDDDYPGMSNMVGAAVWPDRLKCLNGKSPECRGMIHSDALRLLDQMHYAEIKYNPDNVHISKVNDAKPFPFQGLTYLLKVVYGFFDESFRHFESNNFYRKISTLDDVIMDDVPELPDDDSYDDGDDYNVMNSSDRWDPWDDVDYTNYYRGAKHDPSGSRFTWGLYMRLVLHMIGDAHQPLHTCEAYTRSYPNGWIGGNVLRVRLQNGDRVKNMNLHTLWDSVGFTATKNWYVDVEPIVEEEAKRLIKKYPKNFFGERIKGHLNGSDLRAMVMDSYSVAVTEVFKYFDMGHVHREGYDITDEWRNDVVEIASQQLVLGGYRLAKVLQGAVKSIPDYLLYDPDNYPVLPLPPPEPVDERSMWAYFFRFLSAFLAIACFLMYRQIDKLHHKVSDNVNLINHP